jgi:hypothetical protein
MRCTHRCRFLHRRQSDGPVPAFGTPCSKPNEFPFRLGKPERAVPRQAPAASASPFDLRYEDQKLKPVMADLSQLCPNNWLPIRSAESRWLPTPKPNAFRPGQIETRREPPGHSEITPSCLVMRRSAVRIRSQAPFQIDVRRECSDRTVVLQINRSAERSALHRIGTATDLTDRERPPMAALVELGPAPVPRPGGCRREPDPQHPLDVL